MMDCVPDEIIAEILSFVDDKDIIQTFSMVCKNWRNISHHYCKHLTLRFYCSENVDDMMEVVCSSFWSNCTDYLILNNCHLKDEHVALLCKAVDNGHYRNVEYLSLASNSNIHISSLIAVNESFSKDRLKTVYFENCSINEGDLDKFFENESHQSIYWFISAAFFVRFYSDNEEKAYEYYERAADLGDANACYELSSKYQGLGEKELQQELFWLTKAHELGNTSATSKLADKYYENADYESAFNYYSKAAEKKSGYAMLKLCGMYENGQFVERNFAESKKWIHRAVNVDEFLSSELAIRYLNGTGGFDKNLGRAILYFQRNLQHSSISKYHIAVMHLEGNEFVEKNVFKAVEMLEGIKYLEYDASLLLGKIYSTGLEGVERNPVAAANRFNYCPILSINETVELGKLYIEMGRDYAAEESFKRAATQGDVEALLLLAEIYEKRNNQHEASACYLKAADQGHTESQYKVGLSYANGIGIYGRDLKRSIEYLSKAADSGHSKAQYELAQILIESNNYPDALKYINLAIEQGNGFAMNILAKWYLNGTFVEKNESKAFDLFEKSCLVGGCSNSFYQLSILYDKGIGCKANKEKHEELRMKAKEMGDEQLVSEENDMELFSNLFI